jgi:hypothetical protein
MMEPIPRPSAQGSGVSPAFDAVIAGGMAKNPIERYPTAGALAEAAHETLTSPERDRAETILRRSETSSHPGAATPAPTAPPTPFNPVTSTEPSTEPTTPPSKRNLWPIVAAAAVIVVVAIAAVGIWLVLKPSNQRHSKASVGKTAPSSTAAPSDDQARLLSLLPQGYLAGVCTPATPESGSIWVNAVAMVTCGQNTQPGGPSHATYGLFPTPDRLKKAFNDDIGNVSLVNCPGEGRSPVSWHYDQTPNQMAGLIACGSYNSHPNVIWTNEEKLMLSDVTGDPATVEDLHTWWDAYG